MKAELRDALEFVFPDSTVSDRPVRSLGVAVARGATASVHVLLNGLAEGKPVHASVAAGGKAASAAAWFRLVDVPVEKNTGPVSFVEREGDVNPFVIRRAPFRVYDAMAPMGSVVEATAPTMALRLHVAIPADARPGRRRYTLRIEQGGECRRLNFAVDVHRAVVAPAGRESFIYTNWFSLGNMASRHGLRPWSEPHWRMIRRYAELMAHARQNTFLCPLGDFFRMERGQPVLDRVRLRRIVRTFTNAGMWTIEGGHLGQRPGGEWNAPAFELTVAGVVATSTQGNAALAKLAGQLMEEIEINGWRQRWIQHVTDEPTDVNAVDYRILSGMVRRHMPGIPIVDATMHLALAGSVDVWCPQAPEYQRHRKEFEAQRATGDRVWFYTCCFPGGPWLNRLLDMELLRPALFGWGAALFDLQGFLHWGLNQYGKTHDPFKQSVVPHTGDNFLPAGDTHVVYPGAGGPWSSLRFEAQREGFEDYELLHRLREKEPEAAGRIVRLAIRGFDRYTKSPVALRRARATLLKATDRL